MMRRRLTGWRPGAAVLMGAATAVSRATGFVRTVVVASALGVTALGDAYNTANVVPTMIFTLMVGGVLTSAVVPILTGYTLGERARAARAILVATFFAGATASVALWLFAPQIVQLLANQVSGRFGYEDYVGLTATWLRWFAPQVALYAISVAAVAIMTAERRLFVGAIAPALTNIAVIAVLMLCIPRGGLGGPGDIRHSTIVLLGAGTTIAVAIGSAIQLRAALRTMTRSGSVVGWSPRHSAVGRLMRSGSWMLLYVTANQVGLAIVISLATRTTGGVSAYQWAFAVMQLPFALVSVSITSAAFSSLSSANHAGQDIRPLVTGASAATLTVLVPVAALLALLAGPIGVAIVGRDGAGLVGAAIRGFAISLVPFATFQLLTRVCYARADTRTPAFTNVIVNTANVAAALGFLMLASNDASSLFALSLAHAASYVVGVALQVRHLRRRNVLRFRDLLDTTSRRSALAAGMVLGVFAAAGRVEFGELPNSIDRYQAALSIVATSLLAAALFAALSSILASRWRTPRSKTTDPDQVRRTDGTTESLGRSTDLV